MHGGNGIADEYHVIRHVMNLEAVTVGVWSGVVTQAQFLPDLPQFRPDAVAPGHVEQHHSVAGTSGFTSHPPTGGTREHRPFLRRFNGGTDWRKAMADAKAR